MRHTLTTWITSRLSGTKALALLAVGALLLAANMNVVARTGAAPGKTRIFYIAADEVNWDYAPLNTNAITGEPFDDEANVFVAQGLNRIGKVYRKALFREYTDGSFSTLKAVPPGWEHLGLLGPAIHAEVGDTIKVIFKNNASRPYSIHPHGVFYQKNAEGAIYDDGTSGGDKDDDALAPGGTYTYIWEVPERAGPGPGDTSSVMWMYHSHVVEPKDENSGLMGPMIITARGKAKADGSPLDVDREIVAMFKVFDENSSWYLDYNTQTFPSNHPTGNRAATLQADEEFVESNLMHSINGYVYGNLPGLTMVRGQRVRWYTMGMGTEVDLHTPHWHGNTLLLNGAAMGMRVDVTDLLPMSMRILDMQPDAPGVWLFHCHVNDHITAGMQARYTVTR